MPDALLTSTPQLHVVVVSPHLDDGVLSLGASMAAWVRMGHHVTLMTVLGCDRESDADAGGWDRRGGFATEGASARGRREEDRRACHVLGLSPVWFPFESSDYERRVTDDEVWGAISPLVDAADVVVVPGFPLIHPDHAWLGALLRSRIGPERLALYAEQPYTAREGGEPFTRATVSTWDRLAKGRAVRAYRSQLPLLALSSLGALARLARADERVAWPVVVSVGEK